MFVSPTFKDGVKFCEPLPFVNFAEPVAPVYVVAVSLLLAKVVSVTCPDVVVASILEAVEY